MKLLPPPGPERRQQLGRLAVLLAALAVVVWYQWGTAEPVSPTSNTAVPGAAAAATAVKLPAPIKLAELDTVSERSEVGRNPFGYGVRPAPPAPPPMPAPVIPSVPLPPPPPQGPPPIALKLTAIIAMPSTGRTMVTLKDPGSGALFQAFEGDTVDGRYRVVKVGTQSVVLSYVDGSGTRTVSLGV
jgi:hypothetical protein